MIRTVRSALAVLFLFVGTASAQYLRVNVPIGPGDSEGTLHLFLFDSRRTTFKIIAQNGSGESHKNLGAAMVTHQCAAGCNGAPTDSAGQPLGLLIADGKTYGKPATKPAAAEGVLYLDGSQPRLRRAAAFFANGSSQPHQLLQAGPFLVEDRNLVVGLDDRRVARRSFILTDGDHQWAIGYAPATTLRKLALALADSETFADFQVTTALNLAGASSSGIWIKREYGPLYLKELRDAGNYLGLVER